MIMLGVGICIGIVLGHYVPKLWTYLSGAGQAIEDKIDSSK